MSKPEAVTSKKLSPRSSDQPRSSSPPSPVSPLSLSQGNSSQRNQSVHPKSPYFAKRPALIVAEEVGENTGTGAPMGLPPEWAQLMASAGPVASTTNSKRSPSAPPRRGGDSGPSTPSSKSNAGSTNSSHSTSNRQTHHNSSSGSSSNITFQDAQKDSIANTSIAGRHSSSNGLETTTTSFSNTLGSSSKSEKDKDRSEKKKKKQLLKEIEEDKMQIEEMKSALELKNKEIADLRMRYLRNTGCEPSSESSHSIIQASQACANAALGDEEKLSIMLQNGADIHLPNPDGRTSLHFATCGGHIQVVQFLLECGAVISARDVFGRTAVDDAIRIGNWKIMQLLYESETLRELKNIEKEYKHADYIPNGRETQKPTNEVHQLQRTMSKLSKYFGETGGPTTAAAAAAALAAASSRSHVPIPSIIHSSSTNDSVSSFSKKSSSMPPGHKINNQSNTSMMKETSGSNASAGPFPLKDSNKSNPSFLSNQSSNNLPSNSNTLMNNPTGTIPPLIANSNSGTFSGSSSEFTSPNSPTSVPIKRKPQRNPSSSLSGSGYNVLPTGSSGSISGNSTPSRSSRGEAGSTGSSGRKSVLKKIWSGLRHGGGSGSGTNVGSSENSADIPVPPKLSSNAYGIAFGVLRGSCQLADCHCTAYHSDSTNSNDVCCSHCKHYPASHLNLGDAGILEGLEHMHITEETQDDMLLIEKTHGVEWPKVINQNLHADETCRTFCDELRNTDFVIDCTEVEFLKKIGQGTSASVYLGNYLEAGDGTAGFGKSGMGSDGRQQKQIAIKVIDFTVTSKRPVDKLRHEILEELRIMSALSEKSDRVVQFFGVITQPRLCILLEYCPHGSMFDVLSSPSFIFDWELFFKWTRQITSGVLDLHNWDPQIVHRDLKSLNLLLDEDYNVKVADFGLSRFIGTDVSKQTTLGKLRGTYAYTDPEVYFGISYSPKSDIYSIGVIIWEMIYRLVKGQYQRPYAEFPFNRDFQIIIQVARKETRPTIPENVPPLLEHLIRMLWSPTASQRPDAQELLNEVSCIEEIYHQNQHTWDNLVVQKLPSTHAIASGSSGSAPGSVGGSHHNAQEASSSSSQNDKSCSISSSSSSADHTPDYSPTGILVPPINTFSGSSSSLLSSQGRADNHSPFCSPTGPSFGSSINLLDHHSSVHPDIDPGHARSSMDEGGKSSKDKIDPKHDSKHWGFLSFSSHHHHSKSKEQTSSSSSSTATTTTSSANSTGEGQQPSPRIRFAEDTISSPPVPIAANNLNDVTNINSPHPFRDEEAAQRKTNHRRSKSAAEPVNSASSVIEESSATKTTPTSIPIVGTSSKSSTQSSSSISSTVSATNPAPSSIEFKDKKKDKHSKYKNKDTSSKKSKT